MGMCGTSKKLEDLVKNFYVCFMLVLKKYHGILCFTKLYIRVLGAVYSGDFLTQFILK